MTPVSPNEIVLQTRLPKNVVVALKQQAIAEGMTASSWLRRVIVRELGGPCFRAWVEEVVSAPGAARAPVAPYLLRRIAPLPGTAAQYWVLHGEGSHRGEPMSRNLSDTQDWVREPYKHRFFLEGSKQPWAIGQTGFDSSAGRLELILRPPSSEDIVVEGVLRARGKLVVLRLHDGQVLRGTVAPSQVGPLAFEFTPQEGGAIRTVPLASVLSVE
jgi:hypothetical protein